MRGVSVTWLSRCKSVHARKLGADNTMQHIQPLRIVLVLCAILHMLPPTALAEQRSYDGSGNNLANPLWGAANRPLVRISYPSSYPGNGLGEVMLSDAQRANPRTVSNTLSRQLQSQPSARGLSDYVTIWGQFLDHDLSLTTSSAGATTNGTAHIAIQDPEDPLGPNPLPFVRSNFVSGGAVGPVRQQVNEVTSYIDGSQVYGSSAVRAAALRTDSGAGAKLLMSSGDLLPFNTMGLPNQNRGPLPDSSLFVTGDIRTNENAGLIAMHTIFAREHNRLVDKIAMQHPAMSAEDQYQLARAIVGAEVQIVTYREFLPALLGTAAAPVVEDYAYDPNLRADITQSFAHSAFRLGHSTVSPAFPLVDNRGTELSQSTLTSTFFNPTLISSNAGAVDWLIKGAATQISQEVDLLMIDGLRNFAMGPPGSGGLDLMALDIQRGRDHGLLDYNSFRGSYDLPVYTTFDQITTNAGLAQALSDVYQNNLSNVDSFVAGLAEDHVPGASVGPLFQAIIAAQFERLRDGDRFFHRSNDAGLYFNGVLRSEIAAIINLDELSLADVIRWNTSITNLQDNVFLAERFVRSGDFNGDGQLDCADINALAAHIAAGNHLVEFDLTLDGLVNGEDRAAWLTEAGFRRLPSGQPFLPADANLDGAVDGSDFNIWNASKFTTTSDWCHGDFNSDGVVDGSDFGIWNAYKFQTSAAGWGPSVPEPSGVCLMGILLFGFQFLYRGPTHSTST